MLVNVSLERDFVEIYDLRNELSTIPAGCGFDGRVLPAFCRFASMRSQNLCGNLAGM
jgi:hypothetical protein